MIRKIAAGLVWAALCVVWVSPAAAAETRVGTIWLEGMEESIEETLFESPLGFYFWYASDTLSVRPGETDGAVTVFNPWSDDLMTFSLITRREAEACAAEHGLDPAALIGEARTQTELYLVPEDGAYSFCVLITEHGLYLRAEGRYAQEAAEGIAKYFGRTVNSVTLCPPQDPGAAED